MISFKMPEKTYTSDRAIPQTPCPITGNPFEFMSGQHAWEALMDERVAQAKQCQISDCTETLEKLLLTPTCDILNKNGKGGVQDDSESKNEIRALHKDTILVGRKAYDAFHEIIEGFKKDSPKEEDAWDERIRTAAIMTKDAMVVALDKFAVDAKGIIRLVEKDENRLEYATFFNYCVNGNVLFFRKVNEALELVYEGRKGGQQRIWTALETSGRIVREAEVA